MRQKLITLCPNSFEIALKIDNFSAWVRNKLLEDASFGSLPEKKKYQYEYKCPVCKGITFRDARYANKCVPCDYPNEYIGELVV